MSHKSSDALNKFIRINLYELGYNKCHFHYYKKF